MPPLDQKCLPKKAWGIWAFEKDRLRGGGKQLVGKKGSENHFRKVGNREMPLPLVGGLYSAKGRKLRWRYKADLELKILREEEKWLL